MKAYSSSKYPYDHVESIKYFPVAVVPMEKVYSKGDIKYFKLFGIKIPYGYASEDLYSVKDKEYRFWLDFDWDFETKSIKEISEIIEECGLSMFFINDILFSCAEVEINYYNKPTSYRYFQNDTEAKAYVDSLLIKCENSGNKLTVEV
jgi:hypothetical protein